MRNDGRRTRRVWPAIWALIPALTVVAPSEARAQSQPPAHHTSSSVVSQSNNPLSDLIGFNFNEYYASTLFDASGVLNVMNMQAVIIPIKRHAGIHHLVRATMPLLMAPATTTSYASGFGDFSLQDAFKFSKEGATFEWGVGPLLVAPTATSETLGAGKWQIGAAGIVVQLLKGGSIVGGVLTWQTDFAGDPDRPGTNFISFQPDIALALGETGFYISTSPIWTFDLVNDRYLIPFSIGFGKVMEVGTTIVNVTFEPQITIYHKGEQQAAAQIFLGLTLQWKRTGKSAPRPALMPLPRRGPF